MVKFGWKRSEKQRDSWLIVAETCGHKAYAYLPFRYLETAEDRHAVLRSLKQTLELEVLRKLEAEVIQQRENK